MSRTHAGRSKNPANASENKSRALSEEAGVVVIISEAFDSTVVDFSDRAPPTRGRTTLDLPARRIRPGVSPFPRPLENNVLAVLERVCDRPLVVRLGANEPTHERRHLLRARAAEGLRQNLADRAVRHE